MGMMQVDHLNEIHQGLDTTTRIIKVKMPLQKRGMASMNTTSTFG
jgi:hypothetical protein